MGMRLKWGLRFGIEATVGVGSVFKLGLRLKLILRSVGVGAKTEAEPMTTGIQAAVSTGEGCELGAWG